MKKPKKIAYRLGRKAGKSERYLCALLSITPDSLAQRVISFWLDELKNSH